ncbi:hypothetical protein PtA15_15A157 [Puccinia triticina]|uniref:ASPIC/UnbV domain-containing protein n=1 Tax=Puccinia triticina TaxID=208348 RepID=A0ABY7D3F0_9BASI|nr:uncharacterized protein PtA15_15A157 [Puccinia triticina]WAQ91765.1 hypothetical protein PtA15_15A157 [Puccinia triticina]
MTHSKKINGKHKGLEGPLIVTNPGLAQVRLAVSWPDRPDCKFNLNEYDQPGVQRALIRVIKKAHGGWLASLHKSSPNNHPLRSRHKPTSSKQPRTDALPPTRTR